MDELIEIYKHDQHFKMFENKLLSVCCDQITDITFKRYLKSLGYIWQSGQDLLSWDYLFLSDKVLYTRSSIFINRLSISEITKNKHIVYFKI